MLYSFPMKHPCGCIRAERGKSAMLDKLKEVYQAVSEGKEAALTFTVDGEAYYRNFHRPERLILLGCGHIGQALCRYAADLGFAVTAVDETPKALLLVYEISRCSL